MASKTEEIKNRYELTFLQFFFLDSIKELKLKHSFVLPVKNYNKYYPVFLYYTRVLFRNFKLPIKIPTRIMSNEHES